MNTVLSDLAPAIINHPDLPMGQAIAIEQDAHTRSELAKQVREMKKKPNCKTCEGSCEGCKDSIFNDGVDAVLKLLEKKE